MASLSYDHRFPMPRRSVSAQVAGLVLWLGVAFAAAGVGAVASIDAAAFYGQLSKPSWAPPANLFGPVWTALYFLMGVAAWFVWREKRAKELTVALSLFVVQLIANAIWSWLFFAWRKGAFAFIEVLILLALIVATAIAFWRIRRVAAVLLLPYIAWVTFASALTFSVWQMNGDKL
jgi:benzodiazapine receptor